MQQNQQINQNKPQQGTPAADQKKPLSWEPAKDTRATPAANANANAVPAAPKRASAIIAAVVILVVLGVWGVSGLREHKGSSDATQAGKEASAESETSGEGALLTVPPQAAGTSVKVEGLSVTQPTWVVVYDKVDGKPGNTLGAALVFPGQNAVEVNLLRATVTGTSYLVGEAASENGSHTYSRTLPQLSAWTTFTAQ